MLQWNSEVSMDITVIDQPGALAPDEQQRLDHLETIIDSGMQSFVIVGKALAAVRDGRLYRGTHRTFESYVSDRWGWTRATAYDYIAASEVQENVRPVVQLPTLRHARMLSAFAADQQRKMAPAIADLSVKDATKVVKQWRDAETNTDAVSEAARREIAEALHEDDPTPAYVAFVKAAEAVIRVLPTLPNDEMNGVAGQIIALRDAYNAARVARGGRA